MKRWFDVQVQKMTDETNHEKTEQAFSLRFCSGSRWALSNGCPRRKQTMESCTSEHTSNQTGPTSFWSVRRPFSSDLCFLACEFYGPQLRAPKKPLKSGLAHSEKHAFPLSQTHLRPVLKKCPVPEEYEWFHTEMLQVPSKTTHDHIFFFAKPVTPRRKSRKIFRNDKNRNQTC